MDNIIPRHLYSGWREALYCDSLAHRPALEPGSLWIQSPRSGNQCSNHIGPPDLPLKP